MNKNLRLLKSKRPSAAVRLHSITLLLLRRRTRAPPPVPLGLLGLRPSRWQMWRPLSYYIDLVAEARRTLDAVGLLHLAGHPVSDIAYGEKRRVELAMALAQKPRVLLLDEPLAGLSNTERSQVKSLIASIPRETTVVMIEHDMDT